MFGRDWLPDLESCLSLRRGHRQPAEVVSIVQAIARTATLAGDEFGRDLLDGGRPDLERGAYELHVKALRTTDVQAVLSRQAAHPVLLDRTAPFSVCLDALDPPRNHLVNGPVGTLFSVIPSSATKPPGAAFLRSGRQICAAGFVLYGPAIVLGVSLGAGTQLYVLDRRTRVFKRSHAETVIPTGVAEFALNSSNIRHWDPPLRAFYDDLVAGRSGPYGEDYTMRWVGALAAETYRILVRGGLFMYPTDDRDGPQQGRLRLIYQAQPIAFIIEQAGGSATDMTGPILDRVPRQLHERTPFVFGSRDIVHRVSSYLESAEVDGEHSPLFRHRTLFRG